jgi:hypothetical protein
MLSEKTSDSDSAMTKNSRDFAGVLSNVGISAAFGAVLGHWIGRLGYKDPLNVSGRVWRWGMGGTFGLIAAYASLKEISQKSDLHEINSVDVPPLDGQTSPSLQIVTPAQDHARVAEPTHAHSQER